MPGLPKPRSRCEGQPEAFTTVGPAPIEAQARRLENALGSFRVEATVVGAKVGPSPDWLRERLIARGDIPRNNVVDATNFVLFELGQPTHVFDLATLKGGRIRKFS